MTIVGTLHGEASYILGIIYSIHYFENRNLVYHQFITHIYLFYSTLGADALLFENYSNIRSKYSNIIHYSKISCFEYSDMHQSLSSLILHSTFSFANPSQYSTIHYKCRRASSLFIPGQNVQIKAGLPSSGLPLQFEPIIVQDPSARWRHSRRKQTPRGRPTFCFML